MNLNKYFCIVDKILDGKGDDDDVGSTKKENSQISQVESEDVTDTKPDPEKKAPGMKYQLIMKKIVIQSQFNFLAHIF